VNVLRDVEVECRQGTLYAQEVTRTLPADDEAYRQKQRRILLRMKTRVGKRMVLVQRKLSFAMKARSQKKNGNVSVIEVVVIHPGLLENGVR